MAARDPSPWELAMLSGGFPDPWQVWYGGEYPSRRPASPIRGWVCSGCGRGYAPSLMVCSHCGPREEPAPAATIGVSRRLGPDDPMDVDD